MEIYKPVQLVTNVLSQYNLSTPISTELEKTSSLVFRQASDIHGARLSSISTATVDSLPVIPPLSYLTELGGGFLSERSICNPYLPEPAVNRSEPLDKSENVQKVVRLPVAKVAPVSQAQRMMTSEFKRQAKLAGYAATNSFFIGGG